MIVTALLIGIERDSHSARLCEHRSRFDEAHYERMPDIANQALPFALRFSKGSKEFSHICRSE